MSEQAIALATFTALVAFAAAVAVFAMGAERRAFRRAPAGPPSGGGPYRGSTIGSPSTPFATLEIADSTVHTARACPACGASIWISRLHRSRARFPRRADSMVRATGAAPVTPIPTETRR